MQSTIYKISAALAQCKVQFSFLLLQLKLAFVTQMSTIILALLTDRLTMCLLFCDTDE